MGGPRVFGLVLALPFAISSSLHAAGYRFVLPTVSAKPGDSLRYTIQGDHEQAAQGFTIAATFPAKDMTIERVHIEDTILEAIHVDFFEKKISTEPGEIAIGVLVDSRPPFDGTLIPAIGRALDFIHLEVKIATQAKGDLKIALKNGLFDPPIDNLYSIDNQGVAVTELTEGTIHLPGNGVGVGAGFLRGDFNRDATLDISDPIGLLRYAFFGGVSPVCLVSGDANDDDAVDVSDPIYLLNFLYGDGPPPPPPSKGPGQDPTPGRLVCDSPIQG